MTLIATADVVVHNIRRDRPSGSVDRGEAERREVVQYRLRGTALRALAPGRGDELWPP